MYCPTLIMADDWDFYVDLDDTNEYNRASLVPIRLYPIEYIVVPCMNHRGYNLTTAPYKDIVQGFSTRVQHRQEHARICRSFNMTKTKCVVDYYSV